MDPGLDLGKSWRQSLWLLGLEDHQRESATVAACAIAVVSAAHVLRVHDARGARHAVDLAAAVLHERR